MKIRDLSIPGSGVIMVTFDSVQEASAYRGLLESYDIKFTDIRRRELVMDRDNYDRLQLRIEMAYLSDGAR